MTAADFTPPLERWYLCFDWHYGAERYPIAGPGDVGGTMSYLLGFYGADLARTMTNWRLLRAVEAERPVEPVRAAA